MKKQFLILFAFISVLALSQVPQRFNKVIVTGDITSPKFIKTGSNADSVLLGNGSARAISTIKTDTVSLSNRINAKAAGNGTANGTNTGDETLTTIKTKLGAATSVSDGYLKYQDFVRFDGKLSSEVDGSTTNELQTISTNGNAGNITLSNSGGTLNLNVNDADASPTNEIQDLSLSGNILTLSSDAPVDISQATAVQANTAKVSNATHTGDVTGSTALTLATVNSSVGTFNNVTINAKGLATAGSNVSYEPTFSKNSGFNKNFGTTTGTVLEGRTFGTAAGSAVGDFQPVITGLTTNNLVKWNGSSMVNSLISDDGNVVKINNSSTNSGILQLYGGGSDHNYSLKGNSSTGFEIWHGVFGEETTKQFSIGSNSGNTTIYSTTASTSPTTGALVVGGGIGADHVRANNFYGSGSNLTGVQLPITLTTNGTSGAATFSGNVLNVPNYDVSGGVNQTQTTFNGSTSGNIVCSMPFQTSSYKKVIIRFSSLNGTGTNTYTYPVAFTNDPAMVWYNYTGTQGTTTVGRSSIIFSGTASNHTGYMLLEGY